MLHSRPQMNRSLQSAVLRLAFVAGCATVFCSVASAQVPAPVVGEAIDTAFPIIIAAVKPKKDPHPHFEGTVMSANIVQITVRGKENEMAVQTFPLNEQVAAKMQQIVDKGGYQYGDKVTVYYDPDTKKAVRIKGKPSKPS